MRARSALVFPIYLLAAFALLTSPALADQVFDLYAGQHILVGHVTVSDDDGQVNVSYAIDDAGWAITETHVYLGTDEPDRNAPGRFPYGDGGLITTAIDYSVPLSALGAACDDTLFVAAHAVVHEVVGYKTSITDFEDSLPSKVTMTPFRWVGPADSYWDIVVTDGGLLDGTYDGWCVDADRTINSGHAYSADVVSSTEDTAAYVEHPENFDQVNWIINQDYVGQDSDCGGAYTWGDVQRAIWELVEDVPSTAGLGTWKQCRVNEILADAINGGGVGFLPECGQQVAVLLVPVNGGGSTIGQTLIGQTTIIGIGAGCVPVLGEGHETAWAAGGLAFPRSRSWGTYGEYDMACGD